jgi:hypothetical protein
MKKKQAQQVNQRTSSSPRRSTRNSKPPTRLGYDGTQGAGYIALDTAKANISHDEVETRETQYVRILYNSSGLLSPAIGKAAVTDPDTLAFDQAMQDTEHKEQWKEAMKNEIEELENHGTWEQVPVTDAKTKILPVTWVLRRKRSPDGEIRKLKGRICIRGDLQEGEFDTFAPVVAWSSVRLFLVLTMTMKWETCSINFSNAFVQAKLDEPVWIHLPRGFHSSGPHKTCLHLKRSLSGLSIAPKMWHQFILKAFLELGLTPSAHDKCLFYKENLLIVLYVDDAGIAAPETKYIDEFIEQLKQKGFSLMKEGSFSEFLGIKFEENVDAGTITLTQKGLIKKIIAATDLDDCNPNWTPATTVALGIDPEGPPMDEKWSYPSIMGMLLYLSTNTRPDIAFAVSQIERFNHNPKKSHASAVKMIVRYLSKTWDKGTIVRPTNDLLIDCYVDADFAGLLVQP